MIHTGLHGALPFMLRRLNSPRHGPHAGEMGHQIFAWPEGTAAEWLLHGYCCGLGGQ